MATSCFVGLTSPVLLAEAKPTLPPTYLVFDNIIATGALEGNAELS